MLKPLTELCSSVRVPIGMYSRQLLQGRGTYTAHTDVAHMGRFGSVRTFRRCVDMSCLFRVPWWQYFIPYLMEVLFGFPLSSHLFPKQLLIGFALQLDFLLLLLKCYDKYVANSNSKRHETHPSLCLKLDYIPFNYYFMFLMFVC